MSQKTQLTNLSECRKATDPCVLLRHFHRTLYWECHCHLPTEHTVLCTQNSKCYFCFSRSCRQYHTYLNLGYSFSMIAVCSMYSSFCILLVNGLRKWCNFPPILESTTRFSHIVPLSKKFMDLEVEKTAKQVKNLLRKFEDLLEFLFPEPKQKI